MRVLDALALASEALSAAQGARMHDRADVVALVKAGIDVETCRTYLNANAPACFDDLVAIAATEEE